jgi:hypothetical protein
MSFFATWDDWKQLGQGCPLGSIDAGKHGVMQPNGHHDGPLLTPRLPYFALRFRQAYLSRLMKPMPRRTRAEGSGTGAIVLPSGPPGIAWMVTVAPEPMVSVST